MQPTADPATEALWREVLTHGHPGRWAFLPSDPRCIVCKQPFEGVGGTMLRVLSGFNRSRMSPNVCNVCEDVLPQGGAEVDVAVLFADVRGSTALGEQLGAADFAALINRFYAVASRVLVEGGSWIDNLVGDEIMALYVPAMGDDYRERSVRTAVALLEELGYRPGGMPWLPVGVGVYAGAAYVGRVGGGAHHVTALGDTVNTAARLQSEAAPGDLVLGEDLYRLVSDAFPDAEQHTIDVRGKAEPLTVHVLRPANF